MVDNTSHYLGLDNCVLAITNRLEKGQENTIESVAHSGKKYEIP